VKVKRSKKIHYAHEYANDCTDKKQRGCIRRDRHHVYPLLKTRYAAWLIAVEADGKKGLLLRFMAITVRQRQYRHFNHQ
jgi:hypothetical protein